MSGCGPSQCLFGWDTTVEEACEQNNTKRLAKLLPGADAVEPAMLPAVAQMAAGSLPMIEDCRHWTWVTQTKGLEQQRWFRQPSLREYPTHEPYGEHTQCAVSYTHLTLPTKRIV